MAGPRRLALVGPTASGKSAVGLRVAEELGDLEIISADSMQVYMGMDTGTAKATAAERARVPHHLLDVVTPDELYTLVRFQRAARAAVAEIEARGHRPLLVGGTGLYVQAVVDDLAIPGRYPEVLARLETEPDTVALHGRLEQLDPVAAGRMEPTNRRRVLRALEVTLGSGQPFSSFGPGLDAFPEGPWDQCGLHIDPAVLRERIAERYQRQLGEGFLDEVRALAAAPSPPGRTAAQALGYRELLAHLSGTCSLTEAIDEAVTRTRQFARRQRSWFRRDPRITWLDGADADRAVAVLVARWRH